MTTNTVYGRGVVVLQSEQNFGPEVGMGVGYFSSTGGGGYFLRQVGHAKVPGGRLVRWESFPENRSLLGASDRSLGIYMYVPVVFSVQRGIFDLRTLHVFFSSA